MKSNDASRSSARLSRSVVAAAATTLLLGTVVASPLAAAAPQKKPVPTPVAIELGAAPNQDVIPLYTDRAAAVAAALGKLPAIIQDALRRTGVPGASVAVVSDGRTVFNRAYGVRDVRTGVKVDTGTVFPIASLSKPMSATILAKAFTDDPSMSWSTPVRTLMPGFTMGDPYVTDNATVGDYFAHRSGIPTGGGDDLEDIGFDRDYILAHLDEIPLAPFRITYQYSNFGLTAGAEAVAHARGQSYEAMAEQLLFAPLGMTSTTATHDGLLAMPDRAVQHARTGPTEFQPLFDRDADAEAPAGGIASTSGDVAKWMAMVLADGQLDGVRFIDPEPLVEAFSSEVITSHNSALDQRPSHYGYGMNVGSAVGGRVVLSHSGAFGMGTATNATLIPDLDLGITILTNGAPVGLPEAVAQAFVDEVMYGTQTRDWVAAYSARFAHFADPSGDLAGQAPPADATAAGPLSDYVGTYTSPYFGTLTVSQKDGNLYGAMGPDGGYAFAITPWNGDTMAFAPTGENALPGSRSSVVFARDGKDVARVTLTYFNRYPEVEVPSGLGVFTRVR